jgi:hypothetical protein
MRHRWTIAMLGAALCAFGAARPASAHGDEGTIQGVAVTSPATLSLRVEANITFVDVGHLAAETSATTSTVSAGGVPPLTSTVAPTTSVDTRTEAPKDRFATTLAFIGILVAIAVVAALAIRSSRRARRSSGS